MRDKATELVNSLQLGIELDLGDRMTIVILELDNKFNFCITRSIANLNANICSKVTFETEEECRESLIETLVNMDTLNDLL